MVFSLIFGMNNLVLKIPTNNCISRRISDNTNITLHTLTPENTKILQ